MNVIRLKNKDISPFYDPVSAVWNEVSPVKVAMAPTPVALVGEKSAFLALSDDHGKINQIEVSALHNNKAIAIKISWEVKDPVDKIHDIDEFEDGVAVVFPMVRNATAVTMGSKGKPINAWYWKAGKQEPYDVVAEGFGTSENRSGAKRGLNANSRYLDGKWHVVFYRNLSGGRGSVRLRPGYKSGIAFAVWEGRNKERSGRKSFSGDFVALDIES